MKFLIPTFVLAGAFGLACSSESSDPDPDPMTSGGSGGSDAMGTGGATSGAGGTGNNAGTTSGGQSTGGSGGSGDLGGNAGEAAEGGSGQGGSGGDPAEGGSDQGGSGGMDPGGPMLELTMEPTGVGGGDWADFVGTATFVEAEGAVTLTIEVTGCPDGEHAWHIHQNGSCGDMGNAAGNHWAVNGNPVGEQQDAVTCAGGTGMTSVEVPDTEWTLGEGDYSIRGHALMIHEGGVANPGDRMACVVIPE